jgi:hypothetical protein
MTMQSLRDKLVFGEEGGESMLPPDRALVVITSTLSTPPTFLLQHFLHELLSKNANAQGEQGCVVFLSFQNALNKYADGMKRLVCFLLTHCRWSFQETDLNQARQQRRLVFIDGCSRLFGPLPKFAQSDGSTILTLTGDSAWIEQIGQSVMKAIGTLRSRPSLIIEGLDFLLAAAQDKITATCLLRFLSTLTEVSNPFTPRSHA